jgi:predicted DNA-binding transcriptional regulator AlpA
MPTTSPSLSRTDLMSWSEFLERLSIDAKSACRLIANRQIPKPCIVLGRRWRWYRRERIERWLSEHFAAAEEAS